MVKQTIQIFGRVKPTKNKSGSYEIDEEDGMPLISFAVPKRANEGYINNKKELYKFRFERIFDQRTKQDEIFEHVAKPVIDNVLSGYNGTIFAYGQTGSGKTFTITGGAERYTDRGIIPRVLSYIFSHFEKNSEYEHTTHVSYLEIYNESGYDLLDPKHEASKLEDLPKVHLMEDQDQNIHLKNLSTHQATSEEDALNLLFLGDTNRMIAETPMNQASTRSHCIFTIHVTSREHGSATIRRSKLHLVDLAGSERVAKTGVSGVLLAEAKYINISLHFLEQVIVSLSEKNRSHIPYRNSMMTSVLRDSLGGNCMTTMIATMSVEPKNIDESISTCRFAQRVALIKNDAIMNEELDPKLMIMKLKKEIAQLKDELAMVTGEQRSDELTEEEIERCREAVKYFLEDPDLDVGINIGADMRKISFCFRLLKESVLTQKPSSANTQGSSARHSRTSELSPGSDDFSHYDDQETKKLKSLLVQRDNEINILVNMLKKEKKRASDAISHLETAGKSYTSDHRSDSTASEPSMHISNSRNSKDRRQNNDKKYTSHHQNQSSYDREGMRSENEERRKKKILGDLSVGRQEAFEIFRRDYNQNNNIDYNKQQLKQRYTEAKSLGEQVNNARAKINKLKSSIEQHRMGRVMQGLVDPENPEPDEMEVDMKNQMETEKQRYKDNFQRLRTLKTEIEHLQHLLEKSKVKLVKDFEIWWAEQTAEAQEQQDHQKTLLPAVNNKSAWKTPPITPLSRRSALGGNLSAESSQMSLISEASSQSHPIHNTKTAVKHTPTAHTSFQSFDSSGNVSQGSASNQHRSMSRIGKDDSGIQMTGDAQADADIMAFLKARQNVIKHAQHLGSR